MCLSPYRDNVNYLLLHTEVKAEAPNVFKSSYEVKYYGTTHFI